MKRGWASPRLRRFATLRPEVEGIVQRCGRATFDIVLVDVEGNWTRDVVGSAEEAAAVGRDLAVRLHQGWDEPRLARRMARDTWGRPGGRRRAV